MIVAASAQDAVSVAIIGRWGLSQSVRGVQVENVLQLGAWNSQAGSGPCSYEERQNGQLIGSIQGSYVRTTSLYNVNGTPRIECSGVSEVGTTRKIGFTLLSVGASSLNVADDAGNGLTFRKL